MTFTKTMRRLASASVLSAAVALVGCASQNETTTSGEYQTAPQATAQPSGGQQSSAAQQGSTTNALYYPTGEARSSAIKVEKSGPTQVRLGQPYNYTITVTNLTDQKLEGVTLQEQLPGNVSVQIQQGAQPAGERQEQAQGQAGTQQYTIGTLQPHETRTIQIQGKANQVGQISSCVTVNYQPTLCTTAMVVNPQIKLTKDVISQGDICNPIVVRYTVTNSGTGASEQIHIQDQLAQGLQTAAGQNTVSFNVPSLQQGQTRAFEVRLKAQKSGQFTSDAVATTSDGLRAASEKTTILAQAPKLEVTVKGPEQDYIGARIPYDVTVKNIGDATAHQTTVRMDLPAEAGQAQTAGATESPQQQIMLNPGESKTIHFDVMGRSAGTVNVAATAQDPCAGTAQARLQTQVRGVPALLLEAVDSNDPVRIGENTTYNIRVKNQGNAADKNVRITVDLPAEEQLISANGDTQATTTGQTITFAPVPSLAAGATANWQVQVKAIKAADVRLRVQVKSDTLSLPGEKLEPTRLY